MDSDNSRDSDSQLVQELFRLRDENRKLKIFNKVYRDQLIKLSWDYKVLHIQVESKIYKLKNES